jgi:hypothetical protein
VDAERRYEFDRLGYLVLPGLLSAGELAALAEASDRLEEEALSCVREPPRKQSLWGRDCHRNADNGFHAYTSGGEGDDLRGFGKTVVVEDFFNADAAYDVLVDHAPTMDVIHDIVQGRIRINNSELRIRYMGNSTHTHMGGPIDHKYRYAFNEHGIDSMMVRMIYFLHDVGIEDGAFSVVPATHKANYPSPYTDRSVDDEPGMIGLEVKAGDAVVFTENLRHGGFTNRSERPRKTLHVGYGPAWMMSQNVATMDEPQYVLRSTLDRYTDAQRSLFVLPGYTV